MQLSRKRNLAPNVQKHAQQSMYAPWQARTTTSSVMLKEMLNIKPKFGTFQILGKEEFSKRTNTRSLEGCDHAKILTKSISSD